MKRIYISGPITGKENFKSCFADAEKELISEGCEVINPARLNDALPQLPYGAYMAACLALLPYASAIYMLKGWEQSEGAKMDFFLGAWSKCSGVLRVAFSSLAATRPDSLK